MIMTVKLILWMKDVKINIAIFFCKAICTLLLVFVIILIIESIGIKNGIF